ncbi:MAG: NAD+ synthase [Actinobacteria bacterium]|nr:NAD+ synthase [Actinomycetota bacterium]
MVIRAALGQLNFTVGDIDGNAARSISAIRESTERGAQVLVLPELTLTGYPPEDLVLKSGFVQANHRALEDVASHTGDLLTVLGFVDTDGGHLYNAAAICHSGEVKAIYRKQLLPNYGVFDERRYFEPGDRHTLIDTGRGVIGVCVCEDIWSPTGPAIAQADAGAQVVLNINASPFHKGKVDERAMMLGERARRSSASVVYVNLVGGQDELVFDGGSLVIDPNGLLTTRLAQFEERLEIVDVPLGEARSLHASNVDRLSLSLRDADGRNAAVPVTPTLDESEEVYRALELALRDYITKNGFSKVALGLSGGVDSTLVASICADALGPENVLGVSMPSEFSSSHSVDDAQDLADNLGIRLFTIPIKSVYHSFLDTLRDSFGDEEPGLAEENLQARIRGTLLMTISNRYGNLIISTGNKSENAVGYATLYGDMAGGFALIRDLFKHEVYALCRWRNTRSPVIPENVLTKAPSAELRHDQRDEDSLPPYEVLDPILESYIERDEGVDEIVARGFDEQVVVDVIALVDRAEYKRRQAPPGPKVTVKSFGRDRRLPITNRWRPKSS